MRTQTWQEVAAHHNTLKAQTCHLFHTFPWIYQIVFNHLTLTLVYLWHHTVAMRVDPTWSLLFIKMLCKISNLLAIKTILEFRKGTEIFHSNRTLKIECTSHNVIHSIGPPNECWLMSKTFRPHWLVTLGHFIGPHLQNRLINHLNKFFFKSNIVHMFVKLKSYEINVVTSLMYVCWV